jgi:hypothetical protein
MSVQALEKDLLVNLWLAAVLFFVLGLTGDAWHAAWAEVYMVHGKGQKLIYSNAPVASSRSVDIQRLTNSSNSSKLSKAAENKGNPSSTETGQTQGESKAQEMVVETKQVNSSVKPNVKTRTLSDPSGLPKEGGI